jgi:hypothetical protein
MNLGNISWKWWSMGEWEDHRWLVESPEMSRFIDMWRLNSEDADPSRDCAMLSPIQKRIRHANGCWVQEFGMDAFSDHILCLKCPSNINNGELIFDQSLIVHHETKINENLGDALGEEWNDRIVYVVISKTSISFTAKLHERSLSL